MAEKKITTTTTDTAVIHRARGFWEKNSRPIIIAGPVIILAIAGWYGYQEFIKKPKEREANEKIFAAESLFDKMASTAGFNKDSASIVINGKEDQNITGVLTVIKNFGGTKAGNRARYIAGATYLHLKDFPKAISHLKEFDGNGAHQVQSKAYIMLGHAYAEQNKTEDALDYYKKAAAVNKKDEGTSSEALFLAASYADATGNKKEAIDLFTKLKAEYPAAKSVEVDKYLARLGILK